MKRALHFIIGYLFGGSIFLLIIPYLFFQLSRLDYIFNYHMIVGSMAIRLALTGVLLLIGLIFVLWSNFYLLFIGKGGPAEGMGVAISPRTKKLVIQGPYKYSRNPMVFGAFTTYLALVIYLNSITGLILLAVLLSLAVIYLKNSEEKRLLKDFGTEYAEYRRKVPMIIPLRQQHRNNS
jgi:protein-S-isoprenylcysteine O-methyltransferase Ste14